MIGFDPRRHPVRSDLAASAYRGRVAAERFVDGRPMRVAASDAPLRRRPADDQPIDTEVLFGETFTVYDENAEGWCWGQLETDSYVGWLPPAVLSDRVATPTHRVAALRTYRYPDAELKLPPVGLVSIGALVTVIGETVTRDLAYALLDDGTAVVARHIVSVADAEPDWVAVAERFVGTPYLWAGRTSLGLDCSALIQLACQAAGIAAPRDSDMQQAELGTVRDLPRARNELRRGDLVFWTGHVGVMTDGETLLHANGHTMTVAAEPFDEAAARIEAAGLPITAIRRIG